MEYRPFLQILPQFFPPNFSNADFSAYLENNSSVLFEFADMFYYTLPSPRYSFY